MTTSRSISSPPLTCCPISAHSSHLFEAAAKNATKGALFCFSSETLPDADFEGRPYTVGRFQRFAHTEAYVREALAAAGFETLEAGDIIVRHEQGLPIAGHLFIARKS
jgi:predicted TPR repeat methyltransferase